ncbi:MAG: smrA [Burkholderiaceae bacterium]|nr:smrA [Burkholderiaceae bacterium]
MKAKSHSLADLAQLKKAIEQEAKERARIEQEQAKQRAQQSRMSNEFLREVQDVAPIKAKDRYIHPPKTNLPPEHVLKKRQQAAGETEQVKKQSIHKRTHNQASDQFDAQHLRDDEVGTYLRRGIPDTLLKKLQKGAWAVSARLDLHGKTVEEARIATSAFLYQAASQSQRVVSIIHGQGFGSASGEATLKTHVKNWLTQNTSVLAFCAAPKNDGGHGAVMVLLHQEKSKTE